MRITIERLRTLVLAAGLLLLGALAVFLVIGKWKSPFSRRDMPKRLGIEIQQEANGVTYTQAHGGHTLFKIHASKVVQLKDSHAVLHDVRIDLYGADGSRVDRIEGSEFEYDQKAGTARATGAVEITLTRPGMAPAIAPKAAAGTIPADKAKGNPLAQTAEAAASGEIRVETSGVTFDQHTGVVTTTQRVQFSMAQGSGSAMGATYDSQQGFLVLSSGVELTTRRGQDTVRIEAQHAEFERDAHLCQLRAATATVRGSQAQAAEARILFRDDGSAVRLQATGGFNLTTAAGGRLAAPTGAMDFDEQNQPRHAHLEGGVTIDSAGDGRTVHGTAPAAELVFGSRGQLRSAHLERGVEIDSKETSLGAAASGALTVHRVWHSPVADIAFRDAGAGQIEPASLHGTGGVTLVSESQRGHAAATPSILAADEVTGTFGPAATLNAMTGTGHARLEETTATGARQTATGDRLEARFAPAVQAGAKSRRGNSPASPAGTTQAQWAVLDGRVTLMQQPAAQPGVAAQPPMRATAGHAEYQSAGQWLHLTQNPRVEQGGLELSAQRIDVSQESGDAFAHGDVKATWAESGGNGQHGSGRGEVPAGVTLGGQGPAHVIAAEAQLHQATGEATFRTHARLWQQDNSVAGPLIVLNRQKQMLVAQTDNPADPVRAVLVSAEPMPGQTAHPGSASTMPAVIRIRGGDLWYSDAARKAVLRGGVLKQVTAETSTATSMSQQVELLLAPAGQHNGNGQAQVERMTANGRVTLSAQGRRGTGEQLLYTSATGDYVLTGTQAAPPRMSAHDRGSVTGEALIFHSRDDSVSIEGGAHNTTTETTAPR